MSMILAWRSFGATRLIDIESVPTPPEILGKVKAEILKIVSLWSVDTSQLEKADSWAKVYAWVHRHCMDCEDFESFELCYIEKL